jgi:DNA-binding GntR family transcriptional regulator
MSVADGDESKPAGSRRSSRRHESLATAELSTEVVHDRLRSAILRGEFDPTVPLSQVQLAARLGVSRTPLREALRMLQREGLIDSEPNRRVRVAELSVGDLEQQYASRVLLEALAVRLTVPLYTANDRSELRQALAKMTELKGRDVDLWESAHHAFHQLLRRYAGKRICRLADDLSDHTERYRRVYMAEPRAWSAAAAEHAAIVDACDDGDAAAASTHLARHLARTALTLIAQFNPEHEPAPVREALRLVTAGADALTVADAQAIRRPPQSAGSLSPSAEG